LGTSVGSVWAGSMERRCDAIDQTRSSRGRPAEATTHTEADDARSRIEERLILGRALRERSPTDAAEYEAVKAAYRTWEDGTTQMLRQLFTTDEVADSFKGRTSIAMGEVPLAREILYLQKDIATSVRHLEGILDQLPYFDLDG
jgi:hypothetical protein